MKKILPVLVTIYSGYVGAEAAPAPADRLTLKQVLETAYKKSPLLGQAEYELKSSHEGLTKAKRAWLPDASLSATGSVGFSYTETKNPQFPILDNKSNAHSNTGRAQFSVRQNLFNGGATYAQMKGAERNADGSSAKYSHSESSFLNEVVKAYSEYQKKLSILKLTRANQLVLKESLEVIKSQYELGEKTIADVATTQAELEEANAKVSTAGSDLMASTARFERLIGIQPEETMAVPVLFENLPASADEAVKVALKLSPEIKQLDAAADTEKHKVTIANKDMLPSLDLNVTGSRTLSGTWEDHRYPGGFGKSRQNNLTVETTLSIPLDYKGAVQAGSRQQKYTAAQQRLAAIYRRQEIKEKVISAWENYQAAKTKIKQHQAQVKAAKIASDSTNEEFNVGSKTTLEVITAETKHFEAQVKLVSAQHDLIQSSYELAHTIGLLNAGALNLDVKPFDAMKHKTSRPIWGLGIEKDRRGYDLT